jgi:hypothetical protein
MTEKAGSARSVRGACVAIRDAGWEALELSNATEVRTINRMEGAGRSNPSGGPQFTLLRELEGTK